LGSLRENLFLGGEKLPRKKKTQNNISKFKNRKLPFEDLPLKTMKVTIYALRWMFLLIFLFIIVGIFILFITGGQSYAQIILGYSIAGFFTFFMGYFGWILAQGIIDMIVGRVDKDDPKLSYYLRKSRKKKYKL